MNQIDQLSSDDRRDLTHGVPNGDEPEVRKGGQATGEAVLLAARRVANKLQAISDADGRPIRFFMTASRASNYTVATALECDKRRNRIEIMSG